VPKRRGPDKKPGTRQRARKKRATSDEPASVPAPPPKRARRTTDQTMPSSSMLETMSTSDSSGIHDLSEVCVFVLDEIRLILCS